MIQPLKGRISSKFGTRIHPISRKESFHNGVDIAAPAGNNIVSPADGIVTEIWDHPKGGRSMAITSHTGWRFGFAHLLSREVVLNQRVSMGQIVAKVGSSGASTGAHLHFTMKQYNELKDPLKYFTFQ